MASLCKYPRKLIIRDKLFMRLFLLFVLGGWMLIWEVKAEEVGLEDPLSPQDVNKLMEEFVNPNNLTVLLDCIVTDGNKSVRIENDHDATKAMDLIEEESSDDPQWKPHSKLIHSHNSTQFWFKIVGEGWCKSIKFEMTWHLNSSFEFPRGTNTGAVKVNNFKDIEISPNGTLTYKDIDGVKHFHQSNQYCVSNRKEDEVSFKICEPNCTACVRKCCKRGTVVDGNDPPKCIKAEPEWEPIFYKDWNQKDKTKRNSTLTIGLPDCTRKYLIHTTHDRKYPNLLLNGTLIVYGAHPQEKTAIPPGHFCIDGIYEQRNEGKPMDNNSVVHYSESEWHQIIIICSPDKRQIPKWISTIYATVNHTAALFLFMTALVYVLLWSHHTIHGWLQFSYAVSLFFAFNFLAIVQSWSQQIYNISPKLCAYLGWLIHVTFLSAFFWLTSMNFDLWWRFSGRRSLRRIRSKPCRENVKIFLIFATFSVGIPILICGIAVAFDYFYVDTPEEALVKLPRFGAQKCYFEDKKVQFPYFYGPLGVLLLIDLLFFTSTVFHLRKIHSNTELARSNSTLEDKKGVRLIAKLFIVCGVLWIFEFISWTANVLFPDSELLLTWIFMPTEIINSLQGIAIFIIFICKQNVLNQLRAKYNWIICFGFRDFS